MPRVGFEPTKTVHALDRSATVIAPVAYCSYIYRTRFPPGVWVASEEKYGKK
jgi:hypothetical protein